MPLPPHLFPLRVERCVCSTAAYLARWGSTCDAATATPACAAELAATGSPTFDALPLNVLGIQPARPLATALRGLDGYRMLPVGVCAPFVPLVVCLQPFWW